MRALPLCLGLALAILVASPVGGATVTADACSAVAVQAAIDAAGSGDVVEVPAGACTWATAVIVPDRKKLTLRGSGMDATVITGVGGAVLRLKQSGSRVTGFGFVNAGIVTDGDDWRIDHNRFTAPCCFFDAILVFGRRPLVHPRGVIDHNAIQNGRVAVVGDADLLAHGLWAQPLALGSAAMVFIEDNTFTSTGWSSAVDGNYGGRYVFRHNVLTDTYIEGHSAQGGNRAIRSWEIYRNTIRQSAIAMWTPIFIRGGTGVIFDNTVVGAWSNPAVTFDNVRSFEARRPEGLCAGRSPYDGNQLANGWPCLDQIGRSTTPACVGQTPCRPQSGDPARLWGNVLNDRPMGVAIVNGTQGWIQAGRDYIDGAPRPGYTPHVYPHPLTR